jgi:hypothetical protein
MIAGCYSLDLYCRFERLPIHFEHLDGAIVPHRHFSDEFPHQFTAQTERSCMEQARARGWKFSNHDATCPRCVKNGTTAKHQTRKEDDL